jgi:hypothetical protein
MGGGDHRVIVPSAIPALINDLYRQIGLLAEEHKQLHKGLGPQSRDHVPVPSE